MVDGTRPVQLALGVALRESASFENFWDDGSNHAAVADMHALSACQSSSVLYLWGTHSCGRTHLLQAACKEARDAGKRAAYLPLGQADALQPEVLEGWELLELVCLDDLQHVAGDARWERALFVLFNELRDAGGSLAISANASARELGVQLPDLSSRLTWGGVYRLSPVPEQAHLAVLQARAEARGFVLPDEVGNYLLRKSRRDMASLCQLLDTLDSASLAAQRRLTIPFVREILDSQL